MEDYVRRLIRCINRIDGKYYDFARESSVGENEIALLYSLLDGGEHSQKSICEEWLIPKTTVNTLVRKLMGEGLVKVTSLSGREKLLMLTDEGRAHAEKVLAPMRRAELQAMAKTVESFSPQFVDALEKFADYFIGYGDKKGD